MPRKETFDLHPEGWASDPQDEFYRLSPLDYCVSQSYSAYCLFFKLPEADIPKIIQVLKRGLEITLSQCRQLCCVLEEHPDGGYCWHKTRDGTVQFHVQWLDENDCPSFDELEASYFATRALGDLDKWCVSPMTYGEKPEAQPVNNPKAAAFQANIVRGGLVFVMHHHHYSNDIMGWSSEVHQLADNCAALWKSVEDPDLPSWDAACLDHSRFMRDDVPEEQKTDGPETPLPNPDHKPCQWQLFHLPKGKIAELKKLASPEDGSYWISSYDAYTAFIWRLLSKHRSKIFGQYAQEEGPLLMGEAINMRKRIHNPPVPARIQGNVVFAALGNRNPTPQLTVKEVISEAPLTKLAWYIRQLTNSVTQKALEDTLDLIAPIRDKTSLFLSPDSFPPMSGFMTDWREVEACTADFGFAKPYAWRFPVNTATPGLMVVYPRRPNGAPSGEDEGNEFSLCIENEIVQDLIDDPEWSSFFEYRGVDG